MESDCSGRYDRRRLAKYVVRQGINMNYMLSIETFVRTSPEIGACLRLRHRELFKVPWFVSWFRGLDELTRMVGLNHDDTKERLQKFLLAISDSLLMFGFAGYYCVKDMERWTEAQHRMAERAGFQHSTKLPFGIIPLRPSVSGSGSGGGCQDTNNSCGVMYGTYALYTNTHTMEESLCYDCLDPAVSRLYEFHVISRDATFVSLSDGTKVVAGSYANNYSSYAWSNSGANDLVPSTVFTALYIKRSLIEEASDDMFDANWGLSHPPTFLTAKLMPDAKLNTLSETTYYAANSLTDAAQLDNVKKQVVAMQNVRALMEKMNGVRYGGCSGGQRQVTRPEDLVRAQRKRKYNRPDLTEGMHPIPEYVDVSAIHAPSVIIDVEALQRQYVRECCSAVRVPYIYYASEAGGGGSSGGNRRKRHHSDGGGGGLNEDEVDFSREQFDGEITGERRMMSRLLGRVYTQTYLTMDIKGIYMATTTSSMTAEDGDNFEEEMSCYGDSSGDCEAHYARIRGAIERGKLHVGLKFEETRIHNAEALLPLLQCMEKGVVSTDYVQRYVYALYGEPESARASAAIENSNNNNNSGGEDRICTADLPV